MLKHLYIKNYALIRALDIDLSEGMTVLTGETGAGKSIILGALNLVMGARADTRSITEGEQRCVIEAVFSCPEWANMRSHADNQIEYSNIRDKEIIIRRELSANGRSRSLVNDEVVTQAELKALSAQLIDIHSQHENLLLGNDSFQLSVVDAIAGNHAEREAYTRAYTAWREAEEQLRKTETLARKCRQDADYVAFQWNELNEAHLDSESLDELEQEQYRLSHAEQIGEALSKTQQILDGDEQSVINALRECRIGDADASLQERIESVVIELRDIARETERLIDRTEVNPERLSLVEERIDTINTLLRKHSVQTVEELISLRDELAQQMQQNDSWDEQLAGLRVAVESAKFKVQSCGEKLTKSREQVRETIRTHLDNDLVQLGIAHAKTDIAITPLEDYTETGHDDVQLLFAANLGQSLRRVSEVASGGEISRVMLAVKALIAGTAGLPTIIFDEIDTGISGDVANRMGEIIHRMASERQIIAITHNPQIAIQADHQFAVYKQDEQDHTETHIRLMNEADRKQYIDNVYATISRASQTQNAQ